MSEGKKIKKLKNLTKDKDKSKNPFAKLEAAKIGYIALAFIISVLLFVGLLFVQDAFTEKIDYVEVLTATQNIPKGEILTKENVKQYFTLTKIDQRMDVKGSIKKKEALYGKKVQIPLQKQEIVCDKDFTDINAFIDKLEHPVQTAIACDNLANSNGGLIRTGDLINITVSAGTISDEMLQMKNVYVSGVKDTSGAMISNTDTSTVSSIILITIEESDAVELDKALKSNGLVRIAKVLYEDFNTANTTKKKSKEPDEAQADTADKTTEPAQTVPVSSIEYTEESNEIEETTESTATTNNAESVNEVLDAIGDVF